MPTVDIHMNQIGLEAAWLEMLRLYVEPLQTRVYTGYYHYVRTPPGHFQDLKRSVQIERVLWRINTDSAKTRRPDACARHPNPPLPIFLIEKASPIF